MAKKTISRIKFEIEQIDELFASYHNLFIRIGNKKPDLIEITALASVLHSFFIEWEKLEKLVTPLMDLWQKTKGELNKFLGTLSE